MFLKSIDRHGKSFSLLIDGSDTYRTMAGGIITVIYSTVWIFLVCFFSQDIYYRVKPTLMTTKTPFENYTQFNLSNNNFFFGVNIQDEHWVTIDYFKYFDIYFIYKHYFFDNKTGQWVKENATSRWKKEFINKCNLKDHAGFLRNTNQNEIPRDSNQSFIDEFSKTIFQRQGLQNYYCANLDHKVGGYWDWEHVWYINFFITNCTKETETVRGVKCASDEERSVIFNNLAYAVFEYSNIFVDPTNYNTPAKTVIIQDFKQLSAKKRKTSTYKFTQNFIKTDSSILFDNLDVNESEKFLTFESVEQDEKEVNYNDKVLFEIPIYISRYLIEQNRSYVTIPSALAQASGIMEIVDIALQFILGFFFDANYNNFLIRSLFEMNSDDEKETILVANPKKEEINIISLELAKDVIPNKINTNFEEENIHNLENLAINNFTNINYNYDPTNPKHLSRTKQTTTFTRYDITEENIKDNKIIQNPNEFNVNPINIDNQIEDVESKNKDYFLHCLEISEIKQKNKIQISFSQEIEYLLGCIQKSNPKISNLMKISKQKLETRLDAINLLRMKDEIRNLKHLLNINKQQWRLFKNVQKTQIFNKEIPETDNDKIELEINKIIKFIVENKKEISEVEKYLFDNMDTEFKIEILKRVRKFFAEK